MTDQERDALLIRIETKVSVLVHEVGRMATTLADMRKEAADAHTAIGERIHNSFMALDRKVDREVSKLHEKIDGLKG